MASNHSQAILHVMASSSSSENQCGRTVVVGAAEYLESCFSQYCLAAVIFISSIILFLLWSVMKRRNKQTSNPQQHNPTLDDAKISAKLKFLERNREHYGYPNSKKGFVDDWRLWEFPTLLPPLDVASGCRHDRQQRQTSYDRISEPEVYLDYAGSALPTRSQLSWIYKQCVLPPSSETLDLAEVLNTQILANPHSLGGGNASDRTWKLMQQSIHCVMKHFGIDDEQCEVEENEENELIPSISSRYRLVFTTGATESLRMVAEHFPWSCLNIKCQPGQTMTMHTQLCSNQTEDTSRLVQSVNVKSVLVYPKNSHTSVIGMRNVALSRGAHFRCISADELQNVSSDWFQSIIEQSMEYCDLMISNNSLEREEKLKAKISTPLNIIWVHHLLILPVECNFGGDRFDWSRTVSASKASTFATYLARRNDTPNNDTNVMKICHKWHVLLDTAKAAATSKVDLPTIVDGNADFAICSFYKMFGHPTGLGALFIKNHGRQMKAKRINSGEEDKSTTHRTDLNWAINEQPVLRHYFGGGSVDVVLPHVDFAVSRNARSKLSSTESKCYGEEFINVSPPSNGTQHFRGIVELAHGFHELDSLGGMTKIFLHSTCLTAELVKGFNSLHHDNGKPVVCIYGKWRHRQKADSTKLIGPTVAFNILDRDGAIIGYDEVSKLASLNQPPIQLRTGCFCNPGACQDALALLDEEVIENWREGHVCGDRRGKINGRPTGCIRASFGKDSLWEDMDALVSFVNKMFVSHDNTSRPNGNSSLSNTVSRFCVDKMYIFPIKSCAAMEVERWPIECNTGKLFFDRDFALVDPSGVAMRLGSYPKMSQIQPYIDMENEVMVVSAPEHEDLVLSLKKSSNVNESAHEVEICGVLCTGNIWGGSKTSNWFTAVLGVRCWLVRRDESRSEYATSNNTQSNKKSYSNEAALLLVSQQSITRLNSIIKSQGWGKQVDSRHFRPNIVVTSVANCQAENGDYNPEDSWRRIVISGRNCQVELLAAGKCARCQMVDVDPTSGMKGNTLKALAQYRRDRGRIYFGTFFSGINDDKHEDSDVVLLEVGDNIRPI